MDFFFFSLSCILQFIRSDKYHYSKVALTSFGQYSITATFPNFGVVDAGTDTWSTTFPDIARMWNPRNCICNYCKSYIIMMFGIVETKLCQTGFKSPYKKKLCVLVVCVVYFWNYFYLIKWSKT